MPSYNYKAKDNKGKTIKGIMTAASEDQLAASLDQMGLCLLSAKKTKIAESHILWERVTRKDLITFSIHLSTTLSAGVPILQSLEDLINESEKPGFKKVIEDITRNIQAGSSFSDALSKHRSIPTL